MSQTASKIVLMICNTAILIWSFWIIEAEEKVSPKEVLLSYLLFILLRLPLYIFTDYFYPEWWKSMVRFLPCVVFLRIRKHLDWKRCFYFAMIAWIGFTMCANIWRTPWLNEQALRFFPFTDSASLNTLLSTALKRGLDFVVVTCLMRLIPLNKIKQITMERFCVIAFVVFCQLYIIQSLGALNHMNAGAGMPELTVYLVFMQVFVVGALVSFERYLTGHAELEQSRMAQMDSHYRYEALRERQEGEGDIRRLHHDMKNHLLAIRCLSGNKQSLENYIDRLLEKEMSALENLPQTGNELLDGLLGEKMLLAEKLHITFTVQVDFRSCITMAGTDLCAIFGNITDNAIEAVRNIREPERRRILLRSEQAAGQLVISCSNPYDGELQKIGDRYISTKQSAGRGIGLSSVRYAVEKNGGLMTVDTEQPGIFRIILLLPLECEEQQHSGPDSTLFPGIL